MSLRSFKRKTGRNEQKEMGGGLTEFLFFFNQIRPFFYDCISESYCFVQEYDTYCWESRKCQCLWVGVEPSLSSTRAKSTHKL